MGKFSKIIQEYKNTYAITKDTYVEFLNYVNEKYFNNELKISKRADGVYYINNRDDIENENKDMKYLDDIYELYQLKHKINRIYEKI